MARKVSQVLWDQWRRRMERQHASGLSIAEFCRRENLPRQGFHIWKRKLRHTASDRQASGDTARVQRSRKRRPIVTTRRRSAHAPARSTAPTCPANFLQLPMTATQPAPWIELALVDGTILRLPQQNLAALITALRLLRGERLELPCGESGHA